MICKYCGHVVPPDRVTEGNGRYEPAPGIKVSGKCTLVSCDNCNHTYTCAPESNKKPWRGE